MSDLIQKFPQWVCQKCSLNVQTTAKVKVTGLLGPEGRLCERCPTHVHNGEFLFYYNQTENDLRFEIDRLEQRIRELRNK